LGAHEVAGEHGSSPVAIHDETDGMILLWARLIRLWPHLV
jgi:hypothetical protein